MKIAALYDIHGNLPALNAVLEELEEIQPDLIVVGGDIVSGPMPAQTLERLAQLGNQVCFISGNGDREVVTAFDGQPLSRRYLPDMPAKVREETHWVAEQLTRSQRDFLAALPEQLVLQVAGLGEVLFCHATPRNDEELFTSITPAERLSSIFSQVTQKIVICGHTHIQFERYSGNLHIINAGSVGMPFAEQPGAYWLLISAQGHDFRRTVYDGETAAQTIRACRSPFVQDFIETNILKTPPPTVMTEILERWSRERL